MYLEAKINNTIAEDSELINAHIYKTTTLEFEVKDISVSFFMRKEKIKQFYWEISHNSKRVDVNDYTGGKKAQLKVLKTHAGTKENPATIHITVFKNRNGEPIDSTTIKLSAEPKITQTQWEFAWVRNLQPIPIFIDQEGLYGIAATVKIFDIQNTQTAIKTFPPILLNSNTEMLEWIAKNPTEIVKKYYYTISYYDNKEQEIIVFNGNKEGLLLTVAPFRYSDKKVVYPENLTPVTVYQEEYFTQAYEPCKYSKIEVTVGNECPIVLFDENKPQPRINRAAIKKIIAGKSTEKLSEKITITLDAVTDECRKPLQGEKSHAGSVFTYNKNTLKAKELVPDKKLEILAFYKYEHLNDDLNFFFKYFIFSALIPEDVYGNISMLKVLNNPANQIRGAIIKAEIDWKNYAQNHKISIATCRYKDAITLKIIPDVAWAFHFDYGNMNSNNQLYYKNIKSIKKINGLKEEIEAYEAVVKRFDSFISIGPAASLTRGLRDVVIALVKDMSLELSVGFQAYYDFNNNTPLTIRDYTKNHPWLGKVYIAGVLTIIIAIEVLLCIVTEGVSAARYLAKINKVKKLSGKWAKVAQQGEKISREKAATLKGMGTALNYVKGLNFSYYKAYQFIAAENNEVGLLIEEHFKFSILNFKKVIKNLSFGEIVYNMTPVGLAINLSQKSLDFVIGMQANMNLFKATKDFVKGDKGKGFKGKGKAIAKAYGDRKEYDYLTYPLQLLKKGTLVAEAYLIETTSSFLKNILETDGEFNAEFGGSIDLEYHIKANNVAKKFELANLIKGTLLQNNDGQEISIAPSGKLSIFITMTAKTNVHIRAMNLLNYDDTNNLGSIKSGTFTLEGAIKLERRFFFKTDSKPYYQDSYVFNGIAGEYILVKKVKKGDKKNKRNEKPKQDKSVAKKFILMQPDSFVSKPEPIF